MNVTDRPTANATLVELIALDLDTCGRCTGTAANLDSAVEAIRADTGRPVVVHRHVVTNRDDAVRLQMVSSPTIRVDDHDIAPELLEGTCDDDVCSCGTGDSIACREWSFDGERHTVAPVEMIVTALRQPATEPDRDEAFVLPENLERFFAGAADETSHACCSADEQSTCCTPRSKPSCCGSAHDRTCGCR